MSESANNISVNLMGKEFVIACPPDAEADLLKAAAYLDKKMQEIRSGGRIIGNEKVAVMAALNIAYELHQGNRSEQQAVDKRLQQMSNLIDQTLNQKSENTPVSDVNTIANESGDFFSSTD